VLFGEDDVGTSKVNAAAQALGKLNPKISIKTIEGDVFYDIGLGYYRHSDLAIGCLDSLGARARVGLSCTLAGIPYLDGGMWSLGGEVRWFIPGEGPTFDDTLEADDYARADERRSCSGFRNAEWDEVTHVPTVATSASIIGGMLAQEAAKYLCGHAVRGGQAIVYNGQSLTMHSAQLPYRAEHTLRYGPHSHVIELNERVADLTPRQLIARAQQELPEDDDDVLLELGRDFLVALQCPTDGRREEVNQLWGKVSEEARICPHCGKARRPEAIRTLDANSPYADRTLTELGVPPGEVLAVHTQTHWLFYELTGDVAHE
jgi:adenylyltransferase/sulfurtransferase